VEVRLAVHLQPFPPTIDLIFSCHGRKSSHAGCNSSPRPSAKPLRDSEPSAVRRTPTAIRCFSPSPVPLGRLVAAAGWQTGERIRLTPGCLDWIADFG